MTVATYGFEDVGEHAVMLLDRARIDAYARAIRAVVRPGDVVADVGAGTGILAALAARCGAAKVYALECGAMSAVAREVMRDNGLSDVVEVVRGDARDAIFSRPPDVVVSETIGNFGFDEDIGALLSVVARRAATGARVVPNHVRMMVAALADRGLRTELAHLAEPAGIAMTALRRRVVNRVVMHHVRADEILGPARPAGVLDLPAGPVPEVMRARLPIERPGSLNAIGGWFEADLVPGITLANGPGSQARSWSNVKLPVDPPLEVAAGDEIDVEIEPRRMLDRSLWTWRLRRGAEPRTGDAMQATVGGASDLARQLRLSTRPSGALRPSARLDAWAAAFGARVEGGADEMAARLYAAMPGRYADLADARQEVVALLEAAGALR